MPPSTTGCLLQMKRRASSYAWTCHLASLSKNLPLKRPPCHAAIPACGCPIGYKRSFILPARGSFFGTSSSGSFSTLSSLLQTLYLSVSNLTVGGSPPVHDRRRTFLQVGGYTFEGSLAASYPLTPATSSATCRLRPPPRSVRRSGNRKRHK